MAGGVRIGGEEIPGTILVGMVAFPPALSVVRTHRFGLFGETEVRSQPAGRPIQIPMLLHNVFPTRRALEEERKRIDGLVGTHGVLELYDNSNTLTTDYASCTFHGFEQRPGQEFGPLPDVVGLIDGGWWIEGALHFYSLGEDDLPAFGLFD